MRIDALMFALVMAAVASSAMAAEKPGKAETSILPNVILGSASLECEIDSTDPGTQRLMLVSGGGVEFEATVSPIVDGTVSIRAPEKGATYAFSSHLAKSAKGSLSGVGPVTIQSLETRVTVDVTAFQQPGGPGSAFSFSSKEVSQRGVYVEFSGVAVSPEGKRYVFKTNLGPSTEGSGTVVPADTNYNSRLKSKRVTLKAPTTTVIRSLE